MEEIKLPILEAISLLSFKTVLLKIGKKIGLRLGGFWAGELKKNSQRKVMSYEVL